MSKLKQQSVFLLLVRRHPAAPLFHEAASETKYQTPSDRCLHGFHAGPSVAPRSAAPGGTEAWGRSQELTQVVLELLGASVLSGGDQVPHEAFDLVVSAVVDQAVGQQGSADGLHVPLGQLLLEAAVREDVLPSTPPGKHTHTHKTV